MDLACKQVEMEQRNIENLKNFCEPQVSAVPRRVPQAHTSGSRTACGSAAY